MRHFCFTYQFILAFIIAAWKVSGLNRKEYALAEGLNNALTQQISELANEKASLEKDKESLVKT